MKLPEAMATNGRGVISLRFNQDQGKPMTIEFLCF